ncbi:hypothetical protein C8Q79DRAFT_1099525 [Trametes meyenii]|nr:hypothetical protein C8Q79DRAFT_1099525 [Trametes meyenii]
MGFLKRFLSLGSNKSRKNKRKENAAHTKDVDAEGRILPRTERLRDHNDPDTSANRLLRSSSTKFSVMSEIDYTSLPPPPPLPSGVIPSTLSLSPSPSLLTVATTPGVQRSGTYVVKVHGRTTHSRTEFPRANPPPSPTKPRSRRSEPKTPAQDRHDNRSDDGDDDEDESRGPRLKEVNFTPKDNSRIYALRQDPSVVSLLNMYDDKGCLDVHAFAGTPPNPAPIPTEFEGKQPRQRTGSTLRQLLGESRPGYMANSNVTEGDISWAERFLDEQPPDDSPPSSPALETPKDTLFSDELSAPHIAAADMTPSSIDADASINYPAISSMEVEVSGTDEGTSDFEVVPAPKPIIEPKTPQRASEVFGFLSRRNTMITKERDLPEIPQDLSPQAIAIREDDGTNRETSDISLDQPHTAIHSADISHSGTSSDTQSHLSHAQIQTATMTKLSSAFASSTLSLNLLASNDEDTNFSVAPAPDAFGQDSALARPPRPSTSSIDDNAMMQGTTSSLFQMHAPYHHHTGSSSSSGGNSRLPPSKIPRGPRPRPLSTCRRDDAQARDPAALSGLAPTQPKSQDKPSIGAPQGCFLRSSKREAFTDIPQRQHRRIASHSSDTDNKPNASLPVLKAPDPPLAAARKRSTKPAFPRKLGKENTPSPPRVPTKAPSPHTSHAGFATPARPHTLVGHLLQRDDLQEPPSPASSSELSPIGQDMMQNLRQQRMRARQVERRKGIWMRE